MNSHQKPRISICIPHWQVNPLISICLRSIRKHSKNYDTEIIVVDDGSKDDSIEYHRSLKWIRLVERPDMQELPNNWPLNVYTAYDSELEVATGEYYMTMHSDVFVKRDDWLDPFLARMAEDDKVAGVGAWKLRLENPLYVFQKRVFGTAIKLVKNALGKKKHIAWRQGHFPRDYCAMYRRAPIIEHNLTFRPIFNAGANLAIAKQLWNAGYQTRMMPVRELAEKIVHVGHATAVVAAERRLNHERAHIKAERRVAALFSEDWVKNLQNDVSLDS